MVKIEELNFSVRTYNILKRAQIDTVEQLQKLSDDELMRIRNLGRHSLEEIHEKLDKLTMTNADHIRSMSDEELASYLIENVWDCHLCSEHFRLDNEPLLRGELCDEKCVAHCLEWLKQPKEKEDETN